jgi:hypothetical protein
MIRCSSSSSAGINSFFVIEVNDEEVSVVFTVREDADGSNIKPSLMILLQMFFIGASLNLRFCVDDESNNMLQMLFAGALHLRLLLMN